MRKLVLLAAMLSLASLCWAGSARRNAVDRLNNAARVLHEIMDAPDQRIPEEIMERAKCVAVIPHLVKGDSFSERSTARVWPHAGRRRAGVRRRS
jgi:lipid-binding SYLF domain-containing protein